MKRVIGIGWLGLTLLLVAIPLRADMQVFTLRHHLAEELAPVLQQQLGAGARVSAYREKLIVQADAAGLELAGRLLAELDAERPQLVVSVRQQRRTAEAGTEAGAAVHLGTGGSAAQATAQTRLGNATASSEQSIRVLLGEAALVAVGQDVPYLSRWGTFSGDTSGVTAQTGYRAVESGFVVRPVRLEGNEVLVEIRQQSEAVRPGRGMAGAGGAPAVEVQRASSSVRVPLGQWFSVAQMQKEGVADGRGLVFWRTGQGYESREIWLRVER